MTGPDQLASARQIGESDFMKGARYLIVDYRQVTHFDLSSEEVRQLADLVRTRNAIPRIAVIASSDFLYGMARMWDLNVGDQPTWTSHVVRTWDEAIAWLEAELPDIDFSETRQLG